MRTILGAVAALGLLAGTALADPSYTNNNWNNWSAGGGFNVETGSFSEGQSWGNAYQSGFGNAGAAGNYSGGNLTGNGGAAHLGAGSAYGAANSYSGVGSYGHGSAYNSSGAMATGSIGGSSGHTWGNSHSHP